MSALVAVGGTAFLFEVAAGRLIEIFPVRGCSHRAGKEARRGYETIDTEEAPASPAPEDQS